MMGPLGLYQHAKYSKPRLSEGYCTDDNARAVQLLLEWQHYGLPTTDKSLRIYLERCWQFMVDAQTPSGNFRNFRSDAGRWLDNAGSEDMQARVARALTTAILYDHQNKEQASEMLRQLIPHLQKLSFPRSRAEAVIALASLPREENIQITLHSLWNHLWQDWHRNADTNWPWPEEQLTYANALLPHGLLAGAVALDRLHDSAISMAIQSSVAFLIDLTYQQPYFWPIGSDGWHQRGSSPALYDQQPIEAHTTLDLLLAYNHLMADKLPNPVIRAPYEWFLGRNSKGVSIVDIKRGACYDGLTPQGVNLNQGAESLLAYLRSALLITHQLD